MERVHESAMTPYVTCEDSNKHDIQLSRQTVLSKNRS